MNIALRPIVLVVGLTALPFAVLAHFKLLEPAEWVKTSDLGDPQKAGPCGLPDTNGDNAKFLTDALELPRFLRQIVKTQNSLNGELSHGVVSTKVHS